MAEGMSMTIEKLRARVHTIMEPGDTPSIRAKMLSIFIITVIIINCISLIFESIGNFYEEMPLLFDTIEIVSVLIFTIEYLLRLWSFSASENYKSWGRLKYMRRPMMIIDLLAILPFYIASMGMDLRAIRIFRVFRVLRILKLGKYSASVNILGQVISKRKEDLTITVAMSLVLMFMASVVVYFAEHDTQPEQFSSVVSAIWWAIATMTPGPPAYQYVQPVTIIGKLAGGVIQLIAIVIIALPTGILGAGFNEELVKHKELQRKEDNDLGNSGDGRYDAAVKDELVKISSRLEKIEKRLDDLQ